MFDSETYTSFIVDKKLEELVSEIDMFEIGVNYLIIGRKQSKNILILIVLSKNLRLIIGLATIITVTLHILSDFLEVFSGGFSADQLWINFVAFLPIPFLMIGLYAVQPPLSGWMSLTGAENLFNSLDKS